MPSIKLSFLVLFGCVQLIFGQLQCGLPDPGVGQQIIGGEPTGPGVWPWQLSVEVFDGTARTLVCGGAIINDNWGITAAQCVYTQTYQLLTVAGLYDRTEPVDTDTQIREINADQIYIYPGFNPDTLLNDVALLRFGQPYDFNITGIKPVCLPPSNTTSYVQNPNCFVTGWGVTAVGGSYSDLLMRTGIDVIGDVNCGMVLDRLLLDSEVCGYDQVSHTTGPCQGDFGDPLSCLVDANFFLAGVTSIVDPGCDGRVPQIFSDIAFYLDWIKSYVEAPSSARAK